MDIYIAQVRYLPDRHIFRVLIAMMMKYNIPKYAHGFATFCFVVKRK